MATTEAKAMLRSGAVLVGFGVGLSLGCLTVRPDPDHCANLEGNRTCEDRYPGERTFCTACGSTPGEDGCVARQPEDDACYSPCGGETRFDDDASCLVEGSSSSGEESGSTGEETGTESGSGSESSTTGPMPCVGNEDCPDAAAPLCEPVSGECVACDAFGAEADAACAGVDPANPVCLDGACVQCTAEAPEACTGMTPICDDATNTCVPCTAHEQCTGEAACNLFTGACLPSDAVVHVGPGQMYTTLGAAVSSFDMMAEGTIIVHQANYDEAVTVDGGRVLALLANAGDTPTLALIAGGAPQLTVGDGTVLLDGLRLSGNADDVGLVVDGGRAWVDRSRIVQNSGGGIVAQNAAELTLRNGFVGDSDSYSALRRANGSSTTVSYSTLGGGTINATGLACVAPDAVEVRNSIIVALGNEGTAGVDVDCPSGSITFTATEVPFAGEGNSAVGELPLLSPEDWFVGYGTGNYHLQDQGLNLFDGVAEWRSGDPTIDIDGETRPTEDGTPDFAGADVP